MRRMSYSNLHGGRYRASLALILNRSLPMQLLLVCNSHCLHRSMSTPRIPPRLSLVLDSDKHAVADGDLGRALMAGAAWAHAETWNRFAPMVFGMAIRALGSESEAEDLVQEVFYRVFVKARTLNQPESLRSFIVSFAIRILKWELRSRKARSWLSFHQPEVFVDMVSASPDLESRDQLRKFYALLERLAPRDHLVFALRHLESMTVEEIASAMKLSTSTVKRSLQHAGKQMSRWIETDLDMVGLLDGKGWNR
jgi:RNA polymerase sigma factor (sigma-70 family)